MSKLPLETINGKQYTPVEGNGKYEHDCKRCALRGCDVCEDEWCEAGSRDDGLNVYFIEPGDTNEQE